MNVSLSRVLGGALLVSGTCIGAGMVGLPVATAAGGFHLTWMLFLLCWAFMTLTAFFMLEISLWHPGETNLIGMANKTLGTWGARLAWCVYLLFMYSLMAAYTAGGSALSTEAALGLGFSIPRYFISPMFVFSFASIVFFGAIWVDRLNRLLMLGLLVTYVALVWAVSPHVHMDLLGEGQAIYILGALPVMVTAFGFHLLIPTLTTYLDHDAQALRWSLFIGSLIPLLVYLTWEMLILGTIPLEGEGGLLAIAEKGDAVTGVTVALNGLLDSDWLGVSAKAFTFFALLSSFVGVALGLFDFLADGLKLGKDYRSKLLLAFLTFGPPFFFAQFFPEGFLLALSYGGVFGAVLLVIYPASMLWCGRESAPASAWRVPVGRCLIGLCILFGLVVIVLQVLQQTHMLPRLTN